MNKKGLAQRFKWASLYPVLFISLGIGLRLKNFFENRSVWLDEAYAALGLVTKSLLSIIFFEPFAPDLPLLPPGFLTVEKILVLAFGSGEMVMRLFPLICSCAALCLFYVFLKRFASSPARPVALLLFALTDALVLYAAEIRPYSGDVLVCLLLFFMAEEALRDKQIKILKMALLGIVAIYFSYPSVLILFCVGGVLSWSAIEAKEWKKLFTLFGVFIVWFLSFVPVYFLSLRPMTQNDRIWRQSIVSFPPASASFLENLQWGGGAIVRAMGDPVGVHPALLFVVFFFVGAWFVLRKNTKMFLIFAGPLTLMLFFSYLRKYPFTGRFLLGSMPVFILFLTEGLFFVASRMGRPQRFCRVVFIAVLLFFPVRVSLQNLFSSREKEAARPVMEFLRRHYRSGDALYLNNSAQYAQGYYHGRFSFEERTKIVGVIKDDFYPDPTFTPEEDILYKIKIFDDEGYGIGHLIGPRAEQEIARKKEALVHNARTWLLLIHAGKKHKTLVLNFFDRQGPRLNAYQDIGAEVYLYDMAQNP